MKKTNENLVILITLFAISIVIANVTGARTITTGLHIGPIELALSGGAITYAVTFLCTDIIGEIWGKATAQRVVKYGFIGQIFATACIMITGVFPATDAVMDNAYQTLLGQNWIFVIGSLSAYLVSQSWDVAVFHAIRDRYIAKHGSTKGGRWLWNNGSTITSQIWDTVIYAVISFGFGLGWVHTHEGRMQLIGIIIGQYLLKACLALLDDAKRRKSAAFRRQVKSGTAPAQRKYSSLFMGGTASAKKQQKSVPPLVNLARAIKCLDVFGRHDPERAEFYAKKYYEDMSMAREFKAMSATNPTAGGFLIPEVYLDEVIELLYSKTIIKELGARTIPLENGNLNIPRMTSGTRAMWGGEGRKIASTQPAFGNLRLSAKRLEAIVPQTRELLMSTKYSADELFAADLSRRMQLGLDWGALYGTGGEFQPTGIANTPGVEKIDAKKMDAQYAADGKLTADFPVYVKSLVMSKNVDDQALGWAFNSFMEGYLKNIKTTTGDYIYRDEMNAGNFLGMPYKVSNQIPTDSKTGCTEMFFGNWADLMIGDQMGLETYTTLDGTWTDENGVQHNAFEENLTGTRALMYDDIGVRHVESFAYVHNIKVI